MIEFKGVRIEHIGMGEPICPSCGAELSVFPQKKTKCAHCGAAIYSRVQPYDGQKRLLSEAMLPLHQRQWDAYSSLKRIVGISTQSPGMRAMYESLRDGKRGETEIDWDLIERWLSPDRDWGVPWKD